MDRATGSTPAASSISVAAPAAWPCGWPSTAGWEWAEPDPVVVEVPGTGPVERRLELTALDLPLVSFRFTYRFPADAAVVVSDSTIRFRSRDEIESGLVAAGFAVHDVREAPDRPGRVLVVVAGRA